MKTQAIRLIDVLFIGPVMVYAAVTHPALHPAAKVFLAVTGVLTVIYNAENYARANR